MSAISFPEYINQITGILNAQMVGGALVIVEFHQDQRSEFHGFIRVRLEFADRSELHMREFIDLTLAEPRIMYVYHYQSHTGQLIFRYDNAAHRPPLGQAEHKHIGDRVLLSGIPTLLQVLDEILAGMN
jgi:hypothetical protein